MHGSEPIQRIRLYPTYGEHLCRWDLRNNEERANQLVSRGIRLLGQYSPEQIINMGTRGIRAEINAGLAILRSFKHKVIGDPVDYYTPNDYEELNEMAKPELFSRSTSEDFVSRKSVGRSDEGFQGCHQDVAESIYRNADLLVRLEIRPEEILQELLSASYSWSQGGEGYQGSPFGEGVFSHHEISASHKRIKPYIYYSFLKLGRRDPIITYSALIPFFFRFWYYTEGTGTPHHLPIERTVWALHIGNHEQQAKAYLEDLRQRENDLFEAKKELTEALEGTGRKDRYGQILIKEPFFGMVKPVIEDALIKNLLQSLKGEKIDKQLAIGSRCYDTEEFEYDGFTPKECQILLKYCDLASIAVKQRIQEEIEKENLRRSGFFDPRLVGGREFAHVLIPGDEVNDLRVFDYCNPEDLPQIKSDAIWALWLRPLGGIFFDLRQERYQEGLELTEAAIKNKVTRAARRLLNAGFNGKIKAEYFYVSYWTVPPSLHSEPQWLADLAQAG